MKKILLAVAVSFVFLSGYSQENPAWAQAKAKFVDGYYIFTDSEPVAEYEVLGVIQWETAVNSVYNRVRDDIIGQAKKKYKTAEALLITLTEADRTHDNINRALVIRFKE